MRNILSIRDPVRNIPQTSKQLLWRYHALKTLQRHWACSTGCLKATTKCCDRKWLKHKRKSLTNPQHETLCLIRAIMYYSKGAFPLLEMVFFPQTLGKEGCFSIFELQFYLPSFESLGICSSMKLSPSVNSYSASISFLPKSSSKVAGD